MTLSSVTIQITPESQPTTPSWMGEVAAFAQILTHTGSLTQIQEQVRFARSFTRICWRANPFLPPVAWSIGEVRSGSWLMWMGRDKQLVNEPCRKRMPYPLPIAGLIRSAHQVTLGASEEKLFAPVPLCFKHIRISSSARLVGLATGITVENCDERSRRSLVTHSSLGFSQPPSSCG